ncbi:MAG: hypothetical protein LBP59_03465 [Planctomycetaceae bacterium]|nr:hypothetical protein [Planctomycetaceae bacterium]
MLQKNCPTCSSCPACPSKTTLCKFAKQIFVNGYKKIIWILDFGFVLYV